MRADAVSERVYMVAAAILLSVACRAFGQGKSEVPSRDEARALLQHAARETNLRSTDSTPFHLLAEAKSFDGKGEIVEGHYELSWRAGDHWSSRIEWANNVEVDVADNNRIWKQGEDTHLVESRRLGHMLDFSGRLKWSAEGKFGKVKSGELDGHAVACVQIPFESLGRQWSLPIASSNIPSERTICLESGSGLPLKFDTGASRLELGEFMAFGEKRFPKTLRLVHSGKTIMEVEVESLAELGPAKLQAFAIPAGAASHPWCSDMVGPWPTRLGDQSPYPFPPPPNSVALPLNMDITKFSVLLFKVGETGAVQNVRAFIPGGEVLLKDKEKSILLKSTFKPAACNSNAIEAEFPLEFHSPMF